MTTSSLIAEPLWQRTRASFARAIEAIGAPATIAALTLLTRSLRRVITGRILRLEHLVPKLLLAEATELHRAERARAKRAVRIEYIPLRGMARTVRLRTPAQHASCRTPRAAHTRPLGSRHAPTSTPERMPRIVRAEDAPFRLACRLEALRRMLENPMPHAERLLRVLIREARRAPQLIQRYALATAHTNEYDKQDHRLGIDVYGACIDAPVAFSDSS